jgi:hypothetical protein
MPLDPIFGLSILGSFIAFGLIARLYVWPRIQAAETYDALLLLVAPHMFRFAGLSFLEPGVVSPSLQASFATQVAYGDLGAALLAIAAVLALRSRANFALATTWAFNLWGSADLLSAYYHGATSGLEPGLLGAAYYIPTVIVPGLLVTHALIFALLVSNRSAMRPAESP